MSTYQEFNRDTLTEGLAKLPPHPSPAPAWERIAAQLDQQEAMTQALKALPGYAPPATVWEHITASLDQNERPRRHIRPRVRRWVAAAAVGSLLLSTWWLTQRDVAEQTSFTYTEEIRMEAPIKTDWRAEDEVMTSVLQRAEQSPIADPLQLDRLKSEFQELTAARKEVELMLERYGRDEDLLLEAARIERERSQVIKTLAAWI